MLRRLMGACGLIGCLLAAPAGAVESAADALMRSVVAPVPPTGGASGGGSTCVAGGLPAALPLRRDDASVWQTGGVHPFGALALVLLLAVGAGVWFWRRAQGPGSRPAGAAVSSGRAGGLAGWQRRGGAPAGRDLQVLQSTRLSGRTSLHVVQWRGRALLLACTDQAVTVLDREPAAPVGAGADA